MAELLGRQDLRWPLRHVQMAGHQMREFLFERAKSGRIPVRGAQEIARGRVHLLRQRELGAWQLGDGERANFDERLQVAPADQIAIDSPAESPGDW